MPAETQRANSSHRPERRGGGGSAERSGGPVINSLSGENKAGNGHYVEVYGGSTASNGHHIDVPNGGSKSRYE